MTKVTNMIHRFCQAFINYLIIFNFIIRSKYLKASRYYPVTPEHIM